MSHHIVSANALHYTYDDGTDALRGVTFTIHHGEAVGIIGANGAGKSTLLLHLAGAILPTGGSVRVGDLPLTAATQREVRRTVGMIFQDPDDQLFMPTVLEDVMFGPNNMGFPHPEAERRALEALSRVGAEHLRDKPPYHLSGGEKRRAAIATVLAMEPAILVMDEPTTGLDPYARRTLMQLVRNFTHTRIVATHDLDMVLDICPRTIVLHEGKVRADGATIELFRDTKLLAECRLEQPLSMQGCPVCSHRKSS